MRTEDRHHPGDRRRWVAPGLALAASVAAHLLLLAALARTVSPQLAVPPQRIAVALVEQGPRPPQVAAAPAAPGRGGTPARRVAPAIPPAPRLRPGAGGAPTSAAETLAREGVARDPGDRPLPDLRPRLSLAVPGPGAAARADGRVEDAAGGADALRRSLAELAGRARVESGLAHPYHFELARALARSWDAERSVKERGLAGYLANTGESLETFARTWARMAEGFGRTGAPSVVDGGSDRMREVSGLPAGPARDALVNAETVRQLRKVWSEGHVATVRVVQGAGGRLESVKLVTPSSDDALDREALEAVPRAVASVPPPAEVLAGRERLATVWEFEIEVSISPPLPVVGVEFDEVLGGLDLRVPLDRRIRKRVRLVAIE